MISEIIEPFLLIFMKKTNFFPVIQGSFTQAEKKWNGSHYTYPAPIKVERHLLVLNLSEYIWRVVYASSPVAHDHWGIFQLIIKDSEAKQSRFSTQDLAGFFLSLLFLPITPCWCSTLIPIIPLSPFLLVSHAREFQIPT